MSLRTVHIVFVGAAMILTWSFGFWCLGEGAGAVPMSGPMGAGALLGGVLLAWYGVVGLRKLPRPEDAG